MTPRMQCDTIATDFNSVTERKYWKATIGGTKALPVVLFNSRSSMIQLTFIPAQSGYLISFSKVSCAFGDFMASAYKALEAVATALKAAGHEVSAPLGGGEGRLRIEFDPKTKQAFATLGSLGDDWPEYGEISFKVLPDIL